MDGEPPHRRVARSNAHCRTANGVVHLRVADGPKWKANGQKNRPLFEPVVLFLPTVSTEQKMRPPLWNVWEGQPKWYRRTDLPSWAPETPAVTFVEQGTL